MSTSEHETMVSAPLAVPADLDISGPDIQGIYRRYAAGYHSIIDRADLDAVVEVQRVLNRQYPDYDLEIRFTAGDQAPWPWSPTPTEPDRGYRCALLEGVVALHVSGRYRVTDAPLYVHVGAPMTVWSRRSDDSTAFDVRPTELQAIKARLLLALLRDRLQAEALAASAWRMADDEE